MQSARRTLCIIIWFILHPPLLVETCSCDSTPPYYYVNGQISLQSYVCHRTNHCRKLYIKHLINLKLHITSAGMEFVCVPNLGRLGIGAAWIIQRWAMHRLNQVLAAVSPF
eukprot:TRINITY_DN15565_c3_g1_i1.p1 TRINITY_DN15565_c3_g1~~TRINITY_DN15565_c3_g1_i1.p1  ORF type:complete len:111 (+),score=4.63 TRINITY_DN15565_c3_g1_i1:343-675(+)